MKSDVLIATLAFFCGLFVCSDACSCMRVHPQQHYCQSDFVILARVKREQVLNTTRVYKVRVRKEYKVSEKGVLALKSGRVITALESAACGAWLEPGKLYVLSGNIFSLKAHINLCNMAIQWQDLTRRQRKGLKMMYRHGCSCQIRTCYGRCYRKPDSCNWNSDCQAKEGICLRQPNKSCMWSRNRALAKCSKEERHRKSQRGGVP